LWGGPVLNTIFAVLICTAISRCQKNKEENCRTSQLGFFREITESVDTEWAFYQLQIILIVDIFICWMSDYQMMLPVLNGMSRKIYVSVKVMKEQK